MKKCIDTRISKFDNIRAFAMLFVIMIHGLVLFVDVNQKSVSLGLLSFSFSVANALFFFISGLFSKPEQIEDKNKTFRQVLFYLVIGFSLKGLRYIGNLITHGDDSAGLLGTGSVEWFMFVLAAFFVIIYCLRKVPKVVLLIASFICGCLIGLISFNNISFIVNNNRDFLYLGCIFVFFPFFLTGYYFTPQKVLSISSKIYVKIISLVIIISWFIYCLINSTQVYKYVALFKARSSYEFISSRSNGIGNCFIQHRLLCYVISFAVLLSIVFVIPNIKIFSVTRLGKYTLSAYFYHYFILYILKYLKVFDVIISIGDIPGCLLLLLICLIILVICCNKYLFYPFDLLRKIIGKLSYKICILISASMFIISAVITYVF